MTSMFALKIQIMIGAIQKNPTFAVRKTLSSERNDALPSSKNFNDFFKNRLLMNKLLMNYFNYFNLESRCLMNEDKGLSFKSLGFIQFLVVQKALNFLGLRDGHCCLLI